MICLLADTNQVGIYLTKRQTRGACFVESCLLTITSRTGPLTILKLLRKDLAPLRILFRQFDGEVLLCPSRLDFDGRERAFNYKLGTIAVVDHKKS